MKKFLNTLALTVFCALALSTYVFADVAIAPMFITFGLIFVLVAAVVIIAVALVIKLIIKISKSRKEK